MRPIRCQLPPRRLPSALSSQPAVTLHASVTDNKKKTITSMKPKRCRSQKTISGSTLSSRGLRLFRQAECVFQLFREENR